MLALVFDTETTGLLDTHLLPLDRQPEIIEFYGAAVDLSTGAVLDELDLLIKPQRPPSEEITRITGIDAAMLEGKPSFAEVAWQIEHAIQRAPVVIAHNLSYDLEIVDLEFERLGQKAPWPRRKICTVEQTVHLKGFRLNLTGLHEHLFGEGFPEAHRARNDVNALIRCCVELYKLGEL